MSLARWLVRSPGLLALLCAICVSFTGITNHGLWAPDEPRVAAIGAEMLTSGDLVVPTLMGEPFLEKPPLAWWVSTASLRIFGRSAGAARLPSGLASFFTLLLVFDLTRRLADARAGLAALLTLASTWGFLWYGHRCVVDVWLLVFVTLGVACFARSALEGGDLRMGGSPSGRWLVGTYVAGGLAFLAKGPVGPVLLGGPILMLLLLTRRWRFFRSWAHLPGAALFLALCGIWPLLLYLHGGWPELKVFVVDNGLFRVVTDPSGEVTLGHQDNPIYTYLLAAPQLLAPWVLVLPAAARWLRSGDLPESWNRRGLIFLSGILPCGVLLLSLPATKRSLYLLPLVPALSPLIGCWLASQHPGTQLAREGRCANLTLVFVLGVVPLGCLVAALAVSGEIVPLPRRARPLEDALSLRLLGVAGLVCGVSLLAVDGEARRWRRGAGRTLSLFTLLGYVVVAVGFNVLVYPAFEPLNGRRAVAEDLLQEDAFAPGLGGLWLDESILGSVVFYADRRIENLYTFDLSEVRGFLDGRRGQNVLVRTKFLPGMPEDVRARLRLLRTWELGDKGSCALYAIEEE